MMSRNIFLGTIVACLLLTMASIAEAQRGGRRGAPGGGAPLFGGGFGRGGPLELLQRDDVREELDLTQTQIRELADLRPEGRAGERGFQAFQNFREMSEEEREAAFARLREQRAEEQKELRTQINKILSTNQRERFTELEFQYQLQRGSPQGALDAAGIDLTDSDRRKLAETQEEVQARIRQKIEELQRNARVEVLSSVISEQQIDRLAGDEFEFRERGPRFGAGSREPRGERARTRRRTAEDDDEEPSTGRRRRRR